MWMVLAFRSWAWPAVKGGKGKALPFPCELGRGLRVWLFHSTSRSLPSRVAPAFGHGDKVQSGKVGWTVLELTMRPVGKGEAWWVSLSMGVGGLSVLAGLLA